MRMLTFIALLLVGSAQSTTLAPVTAEVLFENADIVAVVQVSAGRMLGAGEMSCGATYTGRISRQFKGVESESVEFGHSAGYEIGQQYLLFLTKPGKGFRPLASTNSMSMKAEAEFLKRCASQLTANQVMHSGVGALRVTWAVPLDFKDGVAVPSKYLIFPESITAVPANLGERHDYSGIVWLKKEDVFEYLSTLK